MKTILKYLFRWYVIPWYWGIGTFLMLVSSHALKGPDVVCATMFSLLVTAIAYILCYACVL